MRQQALILPLLSAIALFSLSCTPRSMLTTVVAPPPAQPLSSQQTQQSISIIGASTPYPALKQLAAAYEQRTPNITITFLDSSQSSGGITAVKEQIVDIGTVTRSPKASEADGSLQHQNIANDALLVATHPSVENISNLTTQNLQAIYSGEITNWKALGGPDAKIVLLDRAEDTSAKRLLREYYLGKTLKNSPKAIVLRRESHIIDALQNTPYSIGTLSRAAATTQNLPIQALKLNGIAPTYENIEANNYPMHRTLGIVWHRNRSETAQGFLEFVFSSAGAETLSQAGFVPTAVSASTP